MVCHQAPGDHESVCLCQCVNVNVNVRSYYIHGASYNYDSGLVYCVLKHVSHTHLHTRQAAAGGGIIPTKRHFEKSFFYFVLITGLFQTAVNGDLSRVELPS